MTGERRTSDVIASETSIGVNLAWRTDDRFPERRDSADLRLGFAEEWAAHG
jgi:hypothetical protein